MVLPFYTIDTNTSVLVETSFEFLVNEFAKDFSIRNGNNFVSSDMTVLMRS